jgi:hypothetical protein
MTNELTPLELDRLFALVGRSPFSGRDPGGVPTEPITKEAFGPAAWVENLDSSGLGATVRIDEEGLHVTDGKIFIEDEFGVTVLSGAGFTSNWLDFLASGFYNGTFVGGTTTPITAATETGGADTEAEYLASLSNDIPYWVIETMTLGDDSSVVREADATAVGGFCLKFTGDVLASIYQDVPVIPGNEYDVELSWRHDNSGGATFNRTTAVSWRDKDHALIGSVAEQGLAYTVTQATYISAGFPQGSPVVAPTNARYMRVGVEIDRTAGSPIVRINSFLRRQITFGDIIKLSSSAAFLIVGGTTTIRPLYIELTETTDTGGPGADKVRLRAKDNGAGKTQLVAIFATGAEQVIATQP